MKTVTVFGLGFVGLTTALGFAETGCKVYGLDVDAGRKDLLRSGKIPFSEPYMEDVLNKHLGKAFIVTDDAAAAVRESQYVYYCVGTPYGIDGSADLKYLFSAIDTTIDALSKDGEPIDDMYRILVTKSTIPPSTTESRILPYVKSKGKVADNLDVANNPEFLREGHCWEDFMHADRIVVGCNTERAEKAMRELYSGMGSIPMFFVSLSTGEFVKYLSNTLLATMISYSNEMAYVADRIGGIDVASAFRILHMDKRWGGCNMTTYVYPGCGYGGYCLPKDTCALRAQSMAKGYDPPILREVIATNDGRPAVIADKIAEGLPKDAKIGILGLSFKPCSDDVRDTPAMRIIRELKAKGYNDICAYDPIANKEFALRYPDSGVTILDSARAVYDSSAVIAIVTAWQQFREVPGYGDKRIVDCRYML